MNFNNDLNESSSSLHTSFHDSINQSQFRLDSPAVSQWRKNSVNENPVPMSPPPSQRTLSPVLEKLTCDLRLSPWENNANMSFSELPLRETEGLTQRISSARVA